MKKKTNIALIIISICFIVFGLVVALIPSISISNKTGTTNTIVGKAYLIDLLGGSNISFNSSSSSIVTASTNSFYGFLLVAIMFSIPLFIILNKKIVNCVVFGASLALMAVSASLLNSANEVKDLIDNSSSYGYTNYKVEYVGVILFLVYSISLSIYCFVILILQRYGDKIAQAFANQNASSLEQKLVLLESLYASKAISKDDYEKKKAELLNNL